MGSALHVFESGERYHGQGASSQVTAFRERHFEVFSHLEIHKKFFILAGRLVESRHYRVFQISSVCVLRCVLAHVLRDLYSSIPKPNATMRVVYFTVLDRRVRDPLEAIHLARQSTDSNQ
jgi:hypothetical protein